MLDDRDDDIYFPIYTVISISVRVPKGDNNLGQSGNP